MGHAFAIGALRLRSGPQIFEWFDVREPEFNECGDPERTGLGNVAERSAADVAVVGGVGECSDAYAVENDPDDAAEFCGRFGHKANVAQSVSAIGFRFLVREESKRKLASRAGGRRRDEPR